MRLSGFRHGGIQHGPRFSDIARAVGGVFAARKSHKLAKFALGRMRQRAAVNRMSPAKRKVHLAVRKAEPMRDTAAYSKTSLAGRTRRKKLANDLRQRRNFMMGRKPPTVPQGSISVEQFRKFVAKGGKYSAGSRT